MLRESQGQTLVELAVCFPVFLLLMFGFVDFCLVLFGMGNANFASRVALRYATLHSSTSYNPTTQNDLNNIIAPFLYKYPGNTYSIYVNYVGGNVVGGGVAVYVTVTYHFTLMGNSFGNLSYNSVAAGAIMQ